MTSHFQTRPDLATPVTAKHSVNFEAFFSDLDGAMESVEDEPDLTADQTFLVFLLGGQYFAISVAPVREILDPTPVFQIPDAPANAVGMIDLRGESIIIFDVSSRLGVGSLMPGKQRIIVLETKGRSGQLVGIFADQVLNVVEIAPHNLETPPRLDADQPQDVLRAVARIDGHLTMVLDLNVILVSARMKKLGPH